jgi:hypothetical protein
MSREQLKCAECGAIPNPNDLFCRLCGSDEWLSRDGDSDTPAVAAQPSKVEACPWCEEGNPRIASSVSDALVHTDTPVGRVVCSLGTSAEDVLRSLAAYVGNGGYNAPVVDPAVFERKIRQGIDDIIEVEANRRATALALNNHPDTDTLRELVEALSAFIAFYETALTHLVGRSHEGMNKLKTLQVAYQNAQVTLAKFDAKAKDLH